MATDLPQRHGPLWLPNLGLKVFDQAEWRYRPDLHGPSGEARLRVWRAEGGGFFAVVTETGLGLSVTSAAADIWQRVERRYAGEAFALAELWPEGHSGEEHVDLVLPPRGGQVSWRRLWPAGELVPLRSVLDTWWLVNGADILAP